jgi:rhodanese-related sulfurtransferase
MPADDTFTADSPMGELMAAWPGARRALFARDHIGGCTSCGFQPEESLAKVCARHDTDPEEALAHLRAAAAQDAALSISPADLKARLASPTPPVLLDIRTREEHDAVALPGSRFFSQDLQQEIFADWPKETELVIYDHTGERALDMAAWFAGHGMAHALALTGGIDAYSRLADPTLPRYRIELDT